MKNCPLCSKQLNKEASFNDPYYQLVCITCGDVMVHKDFDPEVLTDSLHLLSGWTRERTEKKEKCLAILPENVKSTTEGISVDAILKLPSIPKSINEKILKLLDAIHIKSKYFGDEIDLPSKDYTLAYLEHFSGEIDHENPFKKLLGQVKKEGWVDNSSMNASKFEITVKGIQWLEESKKVNVDNFDCFVAMKFGDEFLDKAYKEAIHPAIIDAGFEPIQMAFLEHNNNIIDEMIACIRRSRFIIAELSFQNQNVYYEAGYAQGLGIPVIYICHEDHADEIMFDTQHTNQIRWSTNEELRVKLRNRILATIG